MTYESNSTHKVSSVCSAVILLMQQEITKAAAREDFLCIFKTLVTLKVQIGSKNAKERC